MKNQHYIIQLAYPYLERLIVTSADKVLTSFGGSWKTCQSIDLNALLIFFYSGLGYIVGSKVKDVADDWHWALRVSRIYSYLSQYLLLYIYVKALFKTNSETSFYPKLNSSLSHIFFFFLECFKLDF